MKSSSAVPDIKHTLEAFLVLAYRRVAAEGHAKPILLEEIARELKISEGLSEKVASFLETEGLVDYDDQAVDITIPGMLSAEALLRGEPAGPIAKRSRRSAPLPGPAQVRPTRSSRKS